MHGQFRKRYTQTTQEQKMYAVQEVLKNGRGRKDVADELHVSVNSVTTWIRKYKEDGKNALSPYSQEEISRLKEIEKSIMSNKKWSYLKSFPFIFT